MLGYIITAIILCIVFNVAAAYLTARFSPSTYFHTQEEYDKLKASRPYHYDREYPIPWKPGDVKTLEDWAMPHVAITVASVFWIISIPLFLIVALVVAFVTAIYFLVKAAANAGRNHVDKSNRSNQEV